MSDLVLGMLIGGGIVILIQILWRCGGAILEGIGDLFSGW